MTTATPIFHIVVQRPDKVPVPSFPSTHLGDNAKDVPLNRIRVHCRVPKKFAFSSDGESSVSDETTLGYYVSLTPDNAGKLATASNPADGTPASDRGATVPQIVIKCISLSPSKGEKETPLPQSSLQKDLKDLLATTSKSVEGLKPEDLTNLVGKYDALEENSWAAKQNNDMKFKETADLTEQHWESILSNNRVLQGYCYATNKGFYKAPKQAAIPKAAETATSYPATEREVDVVGSKSGASDLSSPATGLSREVMNTIPGMPRFYVDDDSRVEIIEVKNGFQHTLAKQGFSYDAVETNLAVDILGAGISGSGNTTNDRSYDSLRVKNETTSALRVSYLFPRVVLELDSDTLQLSDECLDDILAVKDTDDVDIFYKKYGTIFSTNLLLGGCLQSSKHLSGTETANMEATKEETRWAAGASFAAPKVSIGGNYANTKSTTDKQGTQTIERSAHLTWEARGGDTVLCSNPPLWAYTVKDYHYWRVMEQSGLKRLPDLIREVDIGAHAYLANPKASSGTRNNTGRNAIQAILSRMTHVITNATESDNTLSTIIYHWKKDSKNPESYNKWLSDHKKPYKVEINRRWSDLSSEQKIYYGVYLQLHRGLSLIK